MSKQSFSIITDIHLTKENIDWVSDIVKSCIDQVKHDKLFVAGDVFDQRKSQPLSVLNAFSQILDYAMDRDVQLICIPGNHDKANYASEDSYLDTYKYHPAMTLIRTYDTIQLPNWTVHLIPYFDENDSYKHYLDKVHLDDKKQNALITHIAVNGVTNNDGSVVDQGVSVNHFDQFDKVFVGHYHNSQVINDNIIYIGSLYQANYGEDSGKGMTNVFSDQSYERIKTEFKHYITVKIDLDQIEDAELDKLCFEYGDSDDNVRFKFTGEKHKVVSLDKSKFDQLGIDVKCEYKDAVVDVSFKQASQFSGFDGDKIREEWKVFSDNNDIDKKHGLELLNKVI